jgi:hypothetical protein
MHVDGSGTEYTGIFMQYRTPIVSSGVIVILLIFYFSRKRLPLRSTRLFTAFMISSFVNSLTEISALYTIYHIETIQPWFNRLCNQLFTGSLDVTIYFRFLYVDAKVHNQKRDNFIKLFIKSIPLSGALFMVLSGSLDYYIGSDTRYSYDSMAMTV